MTNPFRLEEVLPDAAVEPLRLPRKPVGTSPQGLAVTLLADYSLCTRAWLPSPTIVELLTESGVTTSASRTAISRLTKRGALENRRQGRHALYRLTTPAAVALALGGREIASFTEEAESWDGCWTLIAFSVPQHGDTERHALRGRLRWMGYAPLYDGLWVSPHGISEKAAVALSGFSVSAMTGFRASQVEFDTAASRSPLAAWDLAGIGKRYESFLREWQPLSSRVQAGTVRGPAAVRARTGVMDAYRQFVVLDPRLPLRTMPRGWLRDDAQALFSAIYDGLAEPASDHVLSVVERVIPGPHPDIRAHTIEELRAGIPAVAPAPPVDPRALGR